MSAFLDLPDGMAVRIGPAGLLIGRHRSCDIQLADETASRRHALVRVAPEGVELIVLGHKPVQIDGKPSALVAVVATGARLDFPGFHCQVRVVRDDESVPVAYALRRGNDRIQINTSPFIIGTAREAHLVVQGWPAHALRFHVAQGTLYVETEADEATHNGAPLTALAAVTPGDQLGFRDQRFTIEIVDDGTASTVTAAQPVQRATAVVIDALPRGGRLTFTFADGPRTVYVPGRRFRLLSALLAKPGEYISDSDLIPIVWDDNDEVGGRQDINVLLTRCRHDLVSGGIAATTLIERAPGGRATRILLATGATVREAD